MKLTPLSRVLATGMCALLMSVIVPSRLAAAGRIEGRVLNGTFNRPVENQTVQLLTPRQGMQELGAVSTNADGRFAFSGGDIDTNSFYLLETEFQGVSYPVPVQFDSSGSSTLVLTVFESTKAETSLRVESLRVLAGAEGSKVRVQEEYVIRNSSRPPRSYVSGEGTFRFRVPPEVSEPTIAVRGLMNMPLTQSPEPGKSPGEFSIGYPLKPGDTTIIVAYEADYTAGQVTLVSAAGYPIDHAELHVFPSSLTVDSKIFQPAGIDPANRVQRFQASNLPRWTTLEASLSGEPAPSSGSDAGQNRGEVRVVPSSMTRLGAPALFCFFLVLLWALGVRVAREWPQWKKRQQTGPEQKELETKVEGLLNSLADLDELFATQKLAERSYWRERLELKARLVAILKKNPSLLEVYAIRRVPR